MVFASHRRKTIGNRQKTGGCQAGTPNKRTAAISERLEAIGCDPIEGMAQLAMDSTNSPELRGRMFAELAQYMAPKRKAVEIERGDHHRVTFALNVSRGPATALVDTDSIQARS
jgi:hypothetical protein